MLPRHLAGDLHRPGSDLAFDGAVGSHRYATGQVEATFDRSVDDQLGLTRDLSLQQGPGCYVGRSSGGLVAWRGRPDSSGFVWGRAVFGEHRNPFVVDACGFRQDLG